MTNPESTKKTPTAPEAKDIKLGRPEEWLGKVKWPSRTARAAAKRATSRTRDAAGDRRKAGARPLSFRDATDNERWLMGMLSKTKFTLAFTNRVSPNPQT